MCRLAQPIERQTPLDRSLAQAGLRRHIVERRAFVDQFGQRRRFLQRLMAAVRDEDMLERARKRLGKRAKKGFRGFPVATIALYGPDDTRATKLRA